MFEVNFALGLFHFRKQPCPPHVAAWPTAENIMKLPSKNFVDANKTLKSAKSLMVNLGVRNSLTFELPVRNARFLINIFNIYIIDLM